MLPLIIRSAKHQRILHPNAASRQVKTCIHKCFSEIKSLCICMKYISGAALFQMFCHVLKCRKQKFIKLIICHLIIFNGKSIRTFKCNVIWRIRNNEIGFLSIHQPCHIFTWCRIAAHQSVSANRPDISTLYKSSLFQCIRQVIVIIFHFWLLVLSIEFSKLFFRKTGQTHIEIHIL